MYGRSNHSLHRTDFLTRMTCTASVHVLPPPSTDSYLQNKHVNVNINDRFNVMKSPTESVSADGTSISVHRWSKCGKVPSLRAQAGVRIRNVMIAAQRSDNHSDTLTRSAISAPHIEPPLYHSMLYIISQLQAWLVLLLQRCNFCSTDLLHAALFF